VVLQVLFAIEAGQHCLQLKHHDLHAENVFLRMLRRPHGRLSAHKDEDSTLFPPMWWRGANLGLAKHLGVVLEDGTKLSMP